MFLLILFTVTIIVLWIIALSKDTEGPFFLSLIASILYGIMLLTIPLSRLDYGANIAAFKAIEASRGEPGNIEAAAWRLKVAETNAWLARTQYNYRYFDIWIPAEVMELKPIE